jgi:DNA-binding GntR family transcriptional regulator
MMHRGKSLTSLTVADMMEIIPVRVALESMAATLAARKITPRDATKLQTQVLRFTKELTRFSQYAEIDFELHEMIWKLAGNRYMELMLDRVAGPMIALQTRVHVLDLDMLISKETEAREGSHRRIVEAVCAGEETKVQRAMQKHVLDFWYQWLQQAHDAESEASDSQESIRSALNLVARWTSSLESKDNALAQLD